MFLFFEKIRQGEVWRLFTPCLLHFDFLHILFNMAWLWILGKQIEERIHWKKLGLLILIVGIVSNTAQYLVSGPSFLGFSGIVVGMAGFIWMRQRNAPWEGYPLSRIVFCFFYSLSLRWSSSDSLPLHLKHFPYLRLRPSLPILRMSSAESGAFCLGGCRFFHGERTDLLHN